MKSLLKNPVARCNAGYTYVVVLIILSLLAGMTAEISQVVRTEQRREQESELLFIGQQFIQAVRSYVETSPPGGARYPRDWADLLQDARVSVMRRHLRKVYVDPLTGKADWGIIRAPDGGIMGVYSLASGTPLKQANFEPSFIQFAGRNSYRDWVFTYQFFLTGQTPIIPAR